MRSRIPSHIRWKGHKKMEELLDDPLAESLYGLFLKAKSSPIHIAFKPKHLQFPLKKIFKMMRSIKSRYNHCCHWKERQSVIVDTEPILDQTNLDIASLLKNREDLEMFIRSGGLNVTINVNNEFKGNIDHMHLAHADVAVGMAEKGANVYHHKIDKYGKE